MHIHTDTLKRFLRAYRSDLVSALCAVLLASILQFPLGHLDGYVIGRLPGSSRPIEQSTSTSASSASKKDTSFIRAQARNARRLLRNILRKKKASSSAGPRAQQGMTHELHAGPPATIIATAETVSPPAVVAPPRITEPFPAFSRTVQPVAKVPNWGAMGTPEEWNRSYAELSDSDFVAIPAYDLSRLLIPLDDLVTPRNIVEITRKLYYSTRFFGAYDIDKGEFTGNHPGVDLKLALGQPLRSIAGGRVHAVRQDARLGNYVIIEHRHPTDGTFYSIYAHLGYISVADDQAVEPGTIIGTVGMTGSTSGPHLHLQIDIGTPGEVSHAPYGPSSIPSRTEAAKHVVNPVEFIQRYSNGE